MRCSSRAPRTLTIAAALTLLSAFAGAQPRGAGTPAPIFGSEIEVVNLSVSVTDAQGQYVTDLKTGDFSVFEDGVRQKLSLFSHDVLPISLALMIDGSASMSSKLKDARAAATQFVKTLRANDLAQVVQFNDRTSILQDFTSDQAALQTAIERTDAAGPTALHNALYVTLKELDRQKNRGEKRRRAVIILSDGEDTSSLVTDTQVIDLAKKTEIAIYTILLRGARSGDSNRPAFSQAYYLLSTLAQDSGGQSFLPNSLSELDAIYGRIAAELRTLYSVGYVSSNPRRDGKWRRIVVRVPGHEDYTIRHKIGYFAMQ
jgi:Ca-activated chloride channel family protein